jgi:hypothetical protein
MAFATFGSGVLYARRTDVANSTPRKFATLQDVSVDFKGELKSLNGQYQFPDSVARGKTSISGKAKFGRVNGPVFNELFFGETPTVGCTLAAFKETATVGTSPTAATSVATASGGTTLTFTAVPAGVVVGSFVSDSTTSAAIAAGTTVTAKTTTTVTLSAPTSASVGSGDSIVFSPSYAVANQTTFGVDLGVVYVGTGEMLTYVASSPTVGEYSVEGGTYIFSSADAGKALYIDYTYTSAASGTTIPITGHLMGFSPTFSATLVAPFRGNSMILTLNACISESLAFATKQDDYAIPELDFQAFLDNSGDIGTLSLSDAA